MIIIKNPDSFVCSFQSLPEQISTEKKEGALQRTLSCQNKKEILECTLLDREFSFSLKSYSSKEGPFEIFYNKQTREFHGLLTNHKGYKVVVHPWDIEGLPTNLKQCTSAKMSAFFDQTHVRIAQLSNGEYKVYLNAKGVGGAGPEDNFSCFLESLQKDNDVKSLQEGVQLSKGSEIALTEGITLGIITSTIGQQVGRFFTDIQAFQKDICQAIDTMLSSENLEEAFYNNLNVLDNHLQAFQEFSKEEVIKLVDQIQYLIEEKKTASQSLEARERFSIQTAGTNIESTIISQLKSIFNHYITTKQEAFKRLDIRKSLEIEEPALKNAKLYKYFGEKLKAAESIQAIEIHKKAIVEYEKYKDTLKGNKAQIESLEKTIKKLKQTVASWHLYFAEKEEKKGHIYQALEEYAKFKTACEQEWIRAFALENVIKKIEELACKKGLMHRAFEAKLDEIKHLSQRKKEENRECFISYAWEKDVQEWIKGSLAVDLKQAGMNVKLDAWGEIRPGEDPNTYMTKIGKVPFVIMVITPTYKDKWERWKKSEAGSGVATGIRMLMEHYHEMVTKQKGAVFVIVRKGNSENAIPPLFKFSKSLDYNKDDDYFKNTLEIAATFHKLEDKVYFAALENFEEERKAILGKDLTSDDYTEAKTWLKSRTEKRKVIYLPERKSNASVTLTVNAPIPNSNFVGRKEELNRLDNALKKSQYGTVALISEEGVKSGKTEIAKKYFYEQLENYAYAFWVSAKNSLSLEFKKIAERLKLAHENKTADEINQRVKEHLEKSANWLLVFDGAESQEDLLPYFPQTGGHVIVTSRNPNWPKSKFHLIQVNVLEENDAIAFLRRITGLSDEGSEFELGNLALELDYLPEALEEEGNQIAKTKLSVPAYQRYRKTLLDLNIASLENFHNLSSTSRDKRFIGGELILRTLEEKFQTESNNIVLTTDEDGISTKQIALRYAYRNANIGNQYKLIWWFDAKSSELIAKEYEKLAEKLQLTIPEEEKNPSKIIELIVQELKQKERKWLFIFEGAKDQNSLNPYLPPENVNGDILITSKSQEWIGIKKLPVKMTFPLEKATYYFCNIVQADSYNSVQTAKELVKELKFSPLAIKQAAAYITAAKTSVLEETVFIEEYFQLFKDEREKLLQTSSSSPKNTETFINRTILNITVKKILKEEEKEKRTPTGFTLQLMNSCTQQAGEIPRASLKKWIGQNFGWENVDFYEENALNRLKRYALVDLTKDSVLVQEEVRNMFIEKDGIETPNIKNEKPDGETLKIPYSHHKFPNENPYFVGRNIELKQLKDLLEQYGQVVLTSHLNVKIGKTEIAKKYFFDNQKQYSHIFWISGEDIFSNFTEIATTLKLNIRNKTPEQIALSAKKHLEDRSDWLMVFDDVKDKNSILPYLPKSGGHVIITSRAQNWEKFHSIEINPLKKEDACTLLTQVSERPHNHKIEELTEELDFLPTALCEAGIKMREAGEIDCVDWYRITTEEQLAKNAAYLKERSNLPPRNEKFTGRELALRRLEETLQAKPNTPIVIAAETGLGGVGKTQIALQYAYRSVDVRKKGYDLIWWFHAKEAYSIMDDYESLANRLGVAITDEDRKQKRVIPIITNHLRAKNVKWLFIFDNAESQKTLKPYLPTLGGDVIITSRNKDWTGIEKLLPVITFQPEESVRYLCKVVGRDDADFKQRALILAEELGHLPLALVQAADYIVGTKIPIEEYTQRFLKHRKELWSFSGPPRKDNYLLTVSITWDITMQKIEEEEKSDTRFSQLPFSCALSLMNLCAYLAPNDIPSYWLIKWITQSHDEKCIQEYADVYIRETIRRLSNYSMIDSTETFVSIHKLVQVVIQDNASKAEREESIRQALRLAAGRFKSYEDEDPSTWSIGMECFPHAVSVTNHALKEKHFLDNENLKEILSTKLDSEITDLERVDLQKKIFYKSKQGKTVLLFEKMGTYALRQGYASQAKEYYTQALEISKAVFGAHHPSVADTLNNLGNAWSDLGKPKKAIEYYTQALEIYKAVFGAHHPSVADTLNNLGNAWSDLGEKKKAIECYTQALEIKKAFFGDSNPSVADTLNNLGVAWSELGEMKKAIEYHTQALEIKKAFFGAHHPSVGDTLNNLGLAYSDLGENKKAIEFYEQALEIKKASYGDNHPSVAETLNNLGVAWSHLGYKKEATQYYEQALEINKAFFGDNHPSIANTLHNLGLAWSHLGYKKEATQYYEQALEINKAFFGNSHPLIAKTLNNLGVAWSSLGKKEKAIEFYEQALLISKAFFGESHPLIAKTLNNLGSAWNDLGENKKATQYYGQALEITKTFYGDSHPSVAETLNNLGNVWSDLGEKNKATQYYEQALEINKGFFGNSHPSVAETLQNLGNVWCDLGEAKKAIQYHMQTLEIFTTFFGDSHPQVAKTLNNLGLAWNDLGETKKAIEYYTQALEIFTTFFGNSHPQVAKTLNNLGLAWNDLVEREKAIEHYEKALEISRTFYGGSHPEIGHLLNNLGEVWSDLNQNEKAIESSTQALQIFKEFYGNNHPAVASVLNNLGRAWNNVGQYKKAIALCEQSLDIYKCFYGTEHLAVVETLHNLGNAWSALGEYKKAIKHYQITSSFYEKRGYKRTKPKMAANNLTALGVVYNKLNRYKNASRHYKAAIEIIHSENNVSIDALAIIVKIRCFQVCNYGDQCKYTKAKAHLLDALYILYNLHILLKPFSSHDYGEEYAVSLPRTWENAGKMLKDSPEEIESSIQCLEEGLEKVLIFDTTDKYVLLRAELWNAMGMVFHNLDPEENHAKRSLEKAMEGFSTFYGDRHPRVATVRLNLAASQRKLGDLETTLFCAESALESFKQFFNDPHPHILQALNLLGKIYHDRGDFERSYEYHKAALSQAKMCYPAPDTHSDKGEAYIGLGNAMRVKGALKKSRNYFIKADTAFTRVCGEKHLTIAKCSNCRGQIYEALAKKENIPIKRIRYNKKALEFYEEAYNIAKTLLGQDHLNILQYKEDFENLKSKKLEELPTEEKKDSTDASLWHTRPLRITTILPREEHSPTDLSTTAANTEVCQKESPLSPESKDTQANSFSAQVFAKLQHFLTPLTGRKESIEQEKGTFDSFLKTIRSIAVLTYDPADPQSGPFLKKLDRIGDIVLGFLGFGAACVVATVNLKNTGKKIGDYKKGKVLRRIAGENDRLLQSEANRLQKNVTNLQGVLSFFNTTKSVLDLTGGATSLTSQFITSIGPIVRSALGLSLCTAALPLILNWHVNTVRKLIRERRVRKEAALAPKASMLSEEDAQVQITPQYHLITAYRTYKGKRKAQKENYSLYRPVEVDTENSINKIACFHRLSKQRHWSLVTTTQLFQSVVDFACSATIATLFASTLFGFGIVIAGVNLIPILNFLVWGLAFTAAGIALYGIYLNASRNNRQKNNIKELNILDKILKMLETLEKEGEQYNAILDQIQALTLVGKLEELTRKKKKGEELSHVLNELKDLQDHEGLRVIMNELALLNIDQLKDHLNTIKETLTTELTKYEAFKGLRDNRIMKSAVLFQRLYEATSDEIKRFTKMETFVQTQLWKRDSNRMARYAVTNMNAFRDVLNTYLQHHSTYQNEEKKEAFLNSLHVDEKAEFSQEAQELIGRKSQMEVATNLLKDAMNW